MTPTPVSPKVRAAAFAGVFAAVILSNISFITPEMLAWLGPWAPFVYGCFFTGLGYVVGWAKPDPLRDLGAQAAAIAPGSGKRAAVIPGTVLDPAPAVPGPAAPPASVTGTVTPAVTSQPVPAPPVPAPVAVPEG